MREILFRGKSKNTGEWLYGDYMFYAGDAQIWQHTDEGTWNALVLPETAGQYTGLRDKNGMRIFEGDILGFINKYRNMNDTWKCTVEFVEGAFVCRYIEADGDGLYNHYSFGRPFSFDTENKDYASALSTVLGARFRRVMHNVGEGAWICGKAWLYPYYENGELAFKRFPADEVLPFWADADHTILDAAVHVYAVQEYDETEQEKMVVKVEVMHGGGVDCFIRKDDGTLEPDPDTRSGPYITEVEQSTGKKTAYNWERIPLICFKSSHHELPLLSRVKCLQDAYNDVLSNFTNQMEEDIHTTILVIKNYEGENLSSFRKNLATYGVIKVRSFEGSEGGVQALTLEVNSENYKVLLALLKDAIIENARGYDAKDERMGGNPNQMNIQSMYSDIDLDANGIEMEFQASMEDLLWFVNRHLANTGKGNYDGMEVKVIFDRDVLINETEAINNCRNSVGILSNETIVKMHPWVTDPEQELRRIKDEKAEEAAEDPYRAAFERNRGEENNPGGSGEQDPTVKGGEGDAKTDKR